MKNNDTANRSLEQAVEACVEFGTSGLRTTRHATDSTEHLLDVLDDIRNTATDALREAGREN